tara:strand:+ start:1139 stop:1258 length:120 start_codon:yes stop_codon:yes gene_type:complete
MKLIDTARKWINYNRENLFIAALLSTISFVSFVAGALIY